jgi:hypothetical protein
MSETAGAGVGIFRSSHGSVHPGGALYFADQTPVRLSVPPSFPHYQPDVAGARNHAWRSAFDELLRRFRSGGKSGAAAQS